MDNVSDQNNYESVTKPVMLKLLSNDCLLNAQFYRSNTNKVSPAVIMMHGYPGGEGDPLGICKVLAENGINVLLFNYQGTWRSEGSFSFENSIQDAGNALEFLLEETNLEKYKIDPLNIVVGGWSYGGAIALMSAIYNEKVNKVLSIAGADESVFGRMMLTDPDFKAYMLDILKNSVYPKGNIRLELDKYLNHWLNHLDDYDHVKYATKLKDKKILLIGGKQDRSVEVKDHILPLYRKLQEMKADSILLEIFDDDHSFRNSRTQMFKMIIKWIKNL